MPLQRNQVRHFQEDQLVHQREVAGGVAPLLVRQVRGAAGTEFPSPQRTPRGGASVGVALQDNAPEEALGHGQGAFQITDVEAVVAAGVVRGGVGLDDPYRQGNHGKGAAVVVVVLAVIHSLAVVEIEAAPDGKTLCIDCGF